MEMRRGGGCLMRNYVTGTNRIEFKKFLKKEIKPTARALVVGPGSIKEDPSTLVIRRIVKGNMIILDAENPPFGYGGAQHFQSAWKEIMKKKLPEITHGSAHKMPFKEGTFNVVYDHSALPYIFYNAYNERNIRKKPAQLNEIISEYLRVLKPGGKVILATGIYDKKDLFYGSDLVRYILKNQKNAAKLKIRFVPVDEQKYKIKNKEIIPAYPSGMVIIIEKGT